MSALRKNVASQVLTFALVNATTGAALTGATVTTKVALDGTQSAGAGTVTELGTGQYKYVPTQGETNGASVGFCFTATNAVPVNLHCFTTSQDPTIAQTGDAYARLGAPAGASVSADIAAVKVVDDAIKAKTDNLPAAPASTTNITAGTITTVTNLTNLPAAAALEATLTAMKGATFSGATDSLEALRDRGDAAWATATGFSTLDAAGVRTAVGLATANLDTQLADLPTAAETGAATWEALRADHGTAGTFGQAVSGVVGNVGGSVLGNVAGSVGSVLGNVDGNVTGSVGSVVGFTPSNIADIISTLGNPDGASVSADIAAVKNDTTLMKGATFDTATDSLEAIRNRGDAAWTTATGFSTLDAAGVRSAVGLASANLDTQLTAIDDLVDTEVAAIYTRLGAPAGASIAADIAGITATVDAADIRAAIGMASANLDTQLDALPTAAEAATAVRSELTTELGRIDVATSTRLATAGYTAPLDAAGVRTAVGLASANLDTQLTAIDDYLDTEIAAIKAKTDLIPASPSTLDAAGVRTAIGMASANLDTQLAAIDDYLDTEVAAIKAKTDLIPAAPASTTNITAAAGIALSAGERTTLADAILDRTDGATSGYTLREALEVILSVLAGKLSGAATATITIRDINDTKNVVVATTDASGNRTAVTVTP